MQREMEVIRKNSMEQIRAVLTEEQKELLRNKRKARNRASGIPPGL
jgi:Spy/CpxP family protein refolding chaperone